MNSEWSFSETMGGGRYPPDPRWDHDPWGNQPIVRYSSRVQDQEIECLREELGTARRMLVNKDDAVHTLRAEVANKQRTLEALRAEIRERDKLMEILALKCAAYETLPQNPFWNEGDNERQREHGSDRRVDPEVQPSAPGEEQTC